MAFQTLNATRPDNVGRPVVTVDRREATVAIVPSRFIH